MLLLFLALLLFFAGLNHAAPKLMAEEGRLSLNAGDLEKNSYVLSGEWTRKEEADGSISHCLLLSLEGAEGWCLHGPLEASPLFFVEEKPAPSPYVFQEAEGLYRIRLVQRAGSPDPIKLQKLFLSRQSSYLAMENSHDSLLLLLAGVALGMLLYALGLFFYRRQEGYLLILALLVYSTMGRSLVYAVPGIRNSSFLRALLLDTVDFPFLSAMADMQLNWIFIISLLAILRYRLLCEFTHPRVNKRLFYSLLGGLALLSALFLQNYTAAQNLLIFFEALIYLLEALSISQVEDVPQVRRTLAAAWAMTFGGWSLIQCMSLGFIPHGNLDLWIPLRGISVVFYELAFMIVINRKFAGKFAEADLLANKLEKANDSLEAKVQEKTLELQASYETIAEMQKQREQFMRSIVHSLKSSLFSLGGYADMALSELRSDPEAAEKHLLRINANTDFAKEIISTLTRALHVEEGQIDFHMASFDFYALLCRVRETGLGNAGQHPILLEPAEAPEKPLLYVGDAFYIRQAIQNVVDNAIYHSQDDSPVRIAIKTEAEGYLVTVRDQGEGISPEDLPHIFDSYFSKKKDRHSVSGLGLSITRNILTRHGGSVRAESRLGEGSCFYLYFPFGLAEHAENL